MSRTYVIGLPVVITVADDGTVTAEVDLSEASDLHDSSASYDERLDALPEPERDAVIDADIAAVQKAVEEGRVVTS